MFKNLQKKTKGFTIIEVLIVLAVAGLILLIVFLAVPALQRNARNTRYKSEASQLMAAVNEWTNNNGGTLPKTAADATAIVALTKNQTINNLTIHTGAATETPQINPSLALLDVGANCGTQGGATLTTTATGATTRSVALVYAVENASGGVVAQCIGSGQ